ncbi:hypothetical protein [Synechococcus sp. WH 8020]|uniref:hypothetical protein n=1 Tax=Synechococcus sp. (strain WH8020) TaxID=32052 RepID=UPI000A67FB8E|nr:hypothetical protein [Synechococcus sp. WH 8020]
MLKHVIQGESAIDQLLDAIHGASRLNRHSKCCIPNFITMLPCQEAMKTIESS